MFWRNGAGPFLPHTNNLIWKLLHNHPIVQWPSSHLLLQKSRRRSHKPVWSLCDGVLMWKGGSHAVYPSCCFRATLAESLSHYIKELIQAYKRLFESFTLLSHFYQNTKVGVMQKQGPWILIAIQKFTDLTVDEIHLSQCKRNEDISFLYFNLIIETIPKDAPIKNIVQKCYCW